MILHVLYIDNDNIFIFLFFFLLFIYLSIVSTLVCIVSEIVEGSISKSLQTSSLENLSLTFATIEVLVNSLLLLLLLLLLLWLFWKETAFPPLRPVSRFFLAISTTRDSTVFSVRSRHTVVSRFCPILAIRAIAWSSSAGFHAGSMMKAWLATVSVRPAAPECPPERIDRSRTLA